MNFGAFFITFLIFNPLSSYIGYKACSRWQDRNSKQVPIHVQEIQRRRYYSLGCIRMWNIQSFRISALCSTVQEHLKATGKVNGQKLWFLHELNENQKFQSQIISSSFLTRNSSQSSAQMALRASTFLFKRQVEMVLNIRSCYITTTFQSRHTKIYFVQKPRTINTPKHQIVQE